MYSIGEVVLYGSNGVCEITEITTKKIGKDSIEYYVLKPVCSDSSTLFVPTQNEMLVSRMRVVLSSDEIKDILSQKTDNEIWIDNKAERCEKIKEIISGGDCMKLVELIIKGKKISVQLGTTSMSFAKKIQDAEVTTFNGAGDALLNMIAGNADAVINDKPVTDYIMTQNKQIAESCLHLKPIATADLFAMVTSKQNTKLKAEMDKALKQLKADGTFNKLHEKWFGVPADPELP